MSNYILPQEDEEVLLYFPPEIRKENDYEKSDAKFFVRRFLERIIVQHNVKETQSIGFVSDIRTMEFLLVDFIEEYKKYWGFNIPDFDNDIDVSVPDKV